MQRSFVYKNLSHNTSIFYELYRFELFKKYLLDMCTVSIKRIGFNLNVPIKRTVQSQNNRQTIKCTGFY